MEILVELISMPLSVEKRIYWPFLISSFLIAYGYLLFKKKKISLKEILDFKILLHPSSLLDLKILILNHFLKGFIFTIFITNRFSMTLIILKFFRFIYPKQIQLGMGNLGAVVFFTILTFTLNDFFRFLHHYLIHRIGFLWKLHTVHHSAEVLTPLTLYRAHPFEVLLAQIRNVFIHGFSIAMAVFLFRGQVSAFDILGVNICGFLFNLIGANLRHSPIPISFGFLEYLFISPRMHQIHHSSSPIHYNKNHGTAFSLWDQLFGSFYRPTSEDLESMKFGLNPDKKTSQGLGYTLISPFISK